MGPGHIKHAGAQPTLEIGEINELGGAPSARVTALYQAFQSTKGTAITIPPDIRVAVWSKFLFIASWSGVGAATRVPIGIVRGMPETRQLLVSAMQEIAEVAHGHGIRLPQDVVATTMAYIDSLPPQGTPSMQRDIAEGKPSELESLCGAVTRLGAKAGVPAPTHTLLYHVLLPLESQVRGLIH